MALCSSRAAALLHPLRPLSGRTAAVEERNTPQLAGRAVTPLCQLHSTGSKHCSARKELTQTPHWVRAGAEGEELPCRSLSLGMGAQAAAPAWLMAPELTTQHLPRGHSKSQFICRAGHKMAQLPLSLHKETSPGLPPAPWISPGLLGGKLQFSGYLGQVSLKERL